MHVRIAFPPEFEPLPGVVVDAERIAATTGGSITLLTDPVEAVTGVDVVVTDTWVSMGKEEEKAHRVAALRDYQVTTELMAHAKSDALFLHCLPADRGYEVAADVIDGPQSVIWDEAENRLHAQKALMVWLLQQN
jgi:ornithine carbamoyltransferase